MLIWIILAAMTGLAVMAVIWPLGRAARPQDARSDDASFYRAALADIERDAARGLLGEKEAQAARIESARRLLRSEAASKNPAPPSQTHSRRKRAALFAAMFVPAATLAIYSLSGAPHLPDQPLAARRAVEPATMDVAEAISRMEAHLAANPNDGKGHELIAPVYLRLDRVEDAVRAYEASLRLNGETAARLADLGEAMTMQAGGVITAQAKQRFDRAVANDPNHFKARFFLAMAREQDGDATGAIAAYEAMVADAPPNANWVGAVRERAARLKPSGESGQVIAALPREQQAGAIRGMVESLAQRLSANGGTQEEWVRLVRSYTVLGEKDAARKALADARRALPADAAGALDALGREIGE